MNDTTDPKKVLFETVREIIKTGRELSNSEREKILDEYILSDPLGIMNSYIILTEHKKKAKCPRPEEEWDETVEKYFNKLQDIQKEFGRAYIELVEKTAEFCSGCKR